ncbi:hypothetical protein RLIN73S_02628 [Rhodanobacter lindaniclasticus]
MFGAPCKRNNLVEMSTESRINRMTVNSNRGNLNLETMWFAS